MPVPWDEHIRFHQRFWVVERIGWMLLSLVLVAALLGAFGDGLLSRVRVSTPDRSLDASFVRVARKQAPVTLRLEVRPAARIDGSLTVWISADYLERFTVNAVTPEPERVVIHDRGTEYRFAAGSSLDAAVVRFSLEAESAGLASGAIGISKESSVPIRQFIFP